MIIKGTEHPTHEESLRQLFTWRRGASGASHQSVSILVLGKKIKATQPDSSQRCPLTQSEIQEISLKLEGEKRITVWMVQHWNRLHKHATACLSVEILKVQQEMALCNQL